MRTSYKVVLGIGAVLLLLAAASAGWLLRGDDDDKAADAASDIKVGVPTIVTAAELTEFAGDHPLYWAGERSGTRIELTLTARNGIFVRYLPKDVKAAAEGEYLTVGTYDSIQGYEALVNAKKKVADVERSTSGAVIAVFKERPLSTYFAFPDSAFQIEVYSPEKGESKKLTDDGTVALLGNTP